MLDSQKLTDFNKRVYSELSKPGKVLFPGLFFGNKILFIGQNPGRPYKPTQDLEIHQRIFEDYSVFLKLHNESYFQSKFFQFLKNFAKNEFKLELNDFSFTNLIKYSLEGNQIKDQYDLKGCLLILKTQIQLLRPKMIVTFGRIVSEALKTEKIEHSAYFHPSYFNYSHTERYEKQ